VKPPLRLGLIGTGTWGRNYLHTVAAIPATRLARTAGRADWRQLVGASDVDALIVAVPPAAQPEIALAAIDAGKPLLLEKPLALSVDAAQRIVDAAAARRVLVMVDHIHLFHPAFEALKRAAATAGPVRAIRAAAGAPGPYRAGVGALWDWGPHDVAMCLDLLGAEPAEVDAALLESRPAGAGFAQRLRLELGFAGGVRALIELDTVGEKHRRFSVEAGSRSLSYDAAPPADAADWPLARAVRAFAGAVAAGSHSPASVELGAAVVRTLARCEKRVGEKSGTVAQ
jgi:predicted dehydrogenase